MKIGLVLEGGANRVLFTSGVLDIMLKNDINIDSIIGVSAGALHGVNYYSKQVGRSIRYTLKYAKDKRYISYRNLILTGNIVNKNFAYYKISKELDKFDNDCFKKQNKDFYVVVTNLESGKAEYLKVEDPLKDIEKLRASSSLPIVSQIVNIDDKKYLDGAIADSIPVEKMISEGCDKIIVILTRPYNYIKPKTEEKKLRIIKWKYRKYPNFINSIKNRHIIYNNTLKRIKQLEKDNKIFVIRPKEELDVRVLERDTNKLKKIYQIGIDTGEEVINKLKEYLKEEE